MVRVLAVIFSRLHLQNVGNDAVNGDVTYQASEKELLCDAGIHESQGWETCQYTGQPGKTKISQRPVTRLPSTHVEISSNLPKSFRNISVDPLKFWKITTVKEVLL